MKYFVRSVKYFFYFTFLFVVIMAALVLIGVVKPDVSLMFRDGYKSLWQIALLFAFVSAFYPRFGFIKRSAIINGEFSDIRGGIIEYMEARGYRLESENGENMTFRLRSKFRALVKMMEDRITMTREMGGFEVEGLTKEVVRIVGGLEYKFRAADED
jgi:translation initiation factor IF-1